MPADAPTPFAQPQTFGFREAWERVLPELARLSEADLIHINVDVPAAITTVLGAWPQIKTTRAQIAQGLPGFDLTSFDKLDLYAMATGHAHTRYLVAKGPAASLPELAEQGVRMRELLRCDANALAIRGMLDADALDTLRNTKGYRDIAFDLFALVHLMRERWSTLAGRTAIEPAELDDAERLAERLVTDLGRRGRGPTEIAAASLDRQRAYTLFFRTYDQVRRALTYLRWEDEDVDGIAPSLFAGRRRRSGREGPIAQLVPAIG